MATTVSLRKKEIVSQFYKRGVLLTSEILNSITDNDDFDSVFARLNSSELTSSSLHSSLTQTIHKEHPKHQTHPLEASKNEDNSKEMDRLKVMAEKGRSDHYTKALAHLNNLREEEQKKAQANEQPVKIITSYQEENKKREVQDFVDYFNNRYRAIERILRQRQGVANNISIKHVLRKKEKEQLTIIGMVSSKDTTKNGNLMLTLEDPTGEVKVLINKNKPDLFRQAEDIVMDEVIAVAGVNGDNIVFANDVFWPDIPLGEMKMCSDDVYAAFISDIHVGSSKFLPDDFDKFLKWINGEVGNDKQKEIASKVKYLFVAGDLVDGVGIYPGQEDELDIKDINEQYIECANLLSKVPKHIHMILCPGNHDAVRLAEPQPLFAKQYAACLYELPNTTIVSNPAIVNIHSSADFAGFNVLLYHGYSFDHFIAEVSNLRNRGGYDRADLIMKFLLQRRHLAPTHTSSPYIPDTTKDPMVIEHVPDFFLSGHIHKTATANYKTTTMICGSCWQAKTAFQEKVGHHPEPSRVPVVNLRTREIKVLKFGSQ